MSHMSSFAPGLFEYEVVPAPTKPKRVPGLSKDNERVAHELAEIFNEMAEDGWEYIRADTINIDNVTGISGNIPVAHTLLVFRRPLALPAPGTRTMAPLVLDNRVA